MITILTYLFHSELAKTYYHSLAMAFNTHVECLLWTVFIEVQIINRLIGVITLE